MMWLPPPSYIGGKGRVECGKNGSLGRMGAVRLTIQDELLRHLVAHHIASDYRVLLVKLIIKESTR
jgi:hypothetical protein